MSHERLPFVYVRPRRQHVVIDLCNFVCVIVGVQCQQFVGQCVSLSHLSLPLPQVLHKDLQWKGKKKESGGLLFDPNKSMSANRYSLNRLISRPTRRSACCFFSASAVYVISCHDSSRPPASLIRWSTSLFASSQLVESCSMLRICLSLSDSLV